MKPSASVETSKKAEPSYHMTKPNDVLDAARVQEVCEKTFSDAMSKLTRDPQNANVSYGISSKGVVYRFTSPTRPLCKASIQLKREEVGNAVYSHFWGTITPIEISVANKEFTNPDPGFRPNFPALMPWTSDVALPAIEVDLWIEESVKDVSLEHITWEKLGSKGEISLRDPIQLLQLLPLEAKKLAFLLNENVEPFLSETGRKFFGHAASSLAELIPQKNKSFLMVKPEGATDYFPRDAIIEEHNMLDHLFNDVAPRDSFPIMAFDIAEVRGSDIQCWLFENELKDIQKVNGVSYEGVVIIGIRGYKRDCLMKFIKNTETVPLSIETTPWSEWSQCETYVGKMTVTVKQDKTIWTSSVGSKAVQQKPNQSSSRITMQESDSLDVWKLKPKTINGVLDRIQTSSDKLSEPFREWSAW